MKIVKQTTKLWELSVLEPSELTLDHQPLHQETCPAVGEKMEKFYKFLSEESIICQDYTIWIWLTFICLGLLQYAFRDAFQQMGIEDEREGNI